MLDRPSTLFFCYSALFATKKTKYSKKAEFEYLFLSLKRFFYIHSSILLRSPSVEYNNIKEWRIVVCCVESGMKLMEEAHNITLSCMQNHETTKKIVKDFFFHSKKLRLTLTWIETFETDLLTVEEEWWHCLVYVWWYSSKCRDSRQQRYNKWKHCKLNYLTTKFNLVGITQHSMIIVNGWIIDEIQ